MPLGKQLDVVEKTRIDVLHKLGHSNRDIARRIGRSEKCIRTYLKTKVTPKKKETRGRKKKLTDEDERAITRRLSSTTASLEEVRKEMKLPVTRQTVHNVVKRSPILKYKLMKRAPRLTKDHKAARINFAQKNQKTKWEGVGLLVFLLYFMFRSFGVMKRSSTLMVLMVFEDIGWIHESRA